jgi:hypothetical protein
MQQSENDGDLFRGGSFLDFIARFWSAVTIQEITLKFYELTRSFSVPKFRFGIIKPG